jgi:hypothetical protein
MTWSLCCLFLELRQIFAAVSDLGIPVTSVNRSGRLGQASDDRNETPFDSSFHEFVYAVGWSPHLPESARLEPDSAHGNVLVHSAGLVRQQLQPRLTP